MFYAQFVLAKKGPLAKIWLAAHWEKKLTKAQIYETDVPQAIEEVIRPKVKMALRTVGHLLLGIVRIYSKKTRYLLADTNEAYLKMKVNFRDGFSFEADLPLNADIDEDFANLHDDFNITVPEFHDADYNEKLILANVSRLEDITLRDDVNYNAMFQINVDDDGFGDEEDYAELEKMYGVGQPSSVRETPQREMIEAVREQASGLDLSENRKNNTSLFDAPPIAMDFDVDFGGEKQENQQFEVQRDGEMFNSMVHDIQYDQAAPDDNFGFEPEAMESEDVVVPPRQHSPESFALEPLDIENMEGGRKKRQRKPRKLLVDAETMITNDAFTGQQRDFTDTVRASSDLAPYSRKMLSFCVSGDLPHLMSRPGIGIQNTELLNEYRKCLVTRPFDPNFTIHELSDTTPSSMDREEAPWEQLGLNEEIPGPAGVPPETDDHFFDDVDYEVENFPMMAERNRTIDHGEEDRMDVEEMAPVGYADENKENYPEEEGSDPFGGSSMSYTNKRGCLESYGFGAQKPCEEDEGKWTKRANHILKKVSSEIEASGSAVFSTITESAKTRKQAAEQFYSLLSLAKSQAITVEQGEPYGEIVIRAGNQFHVALTSSGSSGAIGEETMPRTPMRPLDIV
ncbi:CRE-SCC-1 protein [Caenorhabditis remanei]|uniref:CRE-SCC-1 protein n=1 Tax=Caenorhabditis remanei TaxID=31234 RepID=E3MXE7_CAERE|nr:CRE-SCC-1 protein [Caenorhabditis remanei]